MDETQDWTSGYVADLAYTYGYYREQAPGLIDYLLVNAGFEPPVRANMTYLELGYGQGLTINLHAAAVPGAFYGTDFNPAHTANAQSLARQSGADVHLYEDAFLEFAHRPDLPDFDYITLHGIWSWISEENRKGLVDVFRRKLKTGGALYVSYNTLPGWATTLPLRHMLSLHADTVGSDAQGRLASMDGALAFVRKLQEAQARYFAANPGMKGRLDSIAGQNRQYLVHEYLNSEWRPMFFSEVNDMLTTAKLSFATTATPIEHVENVNLTQPQRKILSELSNHTAFRESVRDYLVNQQFRRDVFTRGTRPISQVERVQRLHNMRVVLTVAASAIELEVKCPIGKVSLNRPVYEAVIAALAADGGSPKRIGDLARRPEIAKLVPGSLMEAITVLIGLNHVFPVQSDEDAAIAKPRCDRLNRHVIDRAQVNGELNYLASPVIGSAVPAARTDRLFLLARRDGKKAPAEWARFAWNTLAKQGQKMVIDGKTLQTPEDNIRELTRQAEHFAEKRLAVLRTLRCVE